MAKTTGNELDPITDLKLKLKEAYKFITYIEENIYCKCHSIYECGHRFYDHTDNCGFKIAEKALKENKW